MFEIVLLETAKRYILPHRLTREAKRMQLQSYTVMFVAPLSYSENLRGNQTKTNPSLSYRF